MQALDSAVTTRESWESICKAFNMSGRKQAWVKQVYRGQDRRVVLGQAWVDDQQTIPTRARQRDNPGIWAIIQMRCKQSPQGKAIRVNPENTGRHQTREHWQLGTLCRVAMAKQYSAEMKRKVPGLSKLCNCEMILRCERDRANSCVCDVSAVDDGNCSPESYVTAWWSESQCDGGVTSGGDRAEGHRPDSWQVLSIFLLFLFTLILSLKELSF